MNIRKVPLGFCNIYEIESATVYCAMQQRGGGLFSEERIELTIYKFIETTFILISVSWSKSKVNRGRGTHFRRVKDRETCQLPKSWIWDDTRSSADNLSSSSRRWLWGSNSSHIQLLADLRSANYPIGQNKLRGFRKLEYLDYEGLCAASPKYKYAPIAILSSGNTRSSAVLSRQ